MENSPLIAATNPRAKRWPLLLLGVLLFITGPVIYAIQIQLKHLETPWYIPGLATLGVLLIAISVWRWRSVFLMAALALFAGVCGVEWFLMLVAMKSPPYAGPAQPGEKVPAFATTLANGASLTNEDLEKGKVAVLVFNRGRW